MQEIPYSRDAAVAYARKWAQAEPGDIVQLGTENGGFYHAPVIISVTPSIMVAAHSDDALDRPLSSYTYEIARFLHIEGVRIK